MQYVQSYLAAKGIIPAGDRNAFIALLNQAWFGLYRRIVDDDTCGFEHVFIGEVGRDEAVSGLHNWIQLYFEEKKNALDYLGYIKPKRNVKLGNERSAPNNHQQLITIQFSWNGHLKKCSSSFIGYLLINLLECNCILLYI
jgi:poly(U)-specific endoribonuclease